MSKPTFGTFAYEWNDWDSFREDESDNYLEVIVTPLKNMRIPNEEEREKHLKRREIAKRASRLKGRKGRLYRIARELGLVDEKTL